MKTTTASEVLSMAERIAALEKKILLLETERSGAAQPCPPSATGCSGARADEQPGADSSVRCSEAERFSAELTKRFTLLKENASQGMFEAYNRGNHMEGRIWSEVSSAYEAALTIVELVAENAGQCNGQRVLPSNGGTHP